MREPNASHEVRRHVPAKTLGINLPRGYHVLETRFRLGLYFGDAEVRGYPVGVDPTQIEKDAARHSARQRWSQPNAPQTKSSTAEDPLTGLPWTPAVLDEATKLALEYDLIAICIHLGGLDSIIEVHGYRESQAVLRQAAQALKGLVDERDRLTRHSGDKLLIVTTRSLDAVATLVEMIHQKIATLALQTGEQRLPQSRIGVASLSSTDDPAEAGALIEALVISAEAASAEQEEPDTESTAEAPAAAAATPSPRIESTERSAPTEALARVAAASPAIAATVSMTKPTAPTPSAPPPTPEPEHVPASAVQPASEAPRPPITSFPVPPSAVSSKATGAQQPSAQPAPASGEAAKAAPKEEVVRAAGGTRRLVLKAVGLDVSGQVATATVEVVLGDRHMTGKAVGRDGEERRLMLIAEATVRAITEFLPRGYGVVLHHIQQAPSEVGNALWSVVFFLTPTGEQSLLGIAPADGDLTEAAANSVLSAVNRRIGTLLGESN